MTDHLCPNCGVQAQHLIPSGGSAYFKCGNCKTPFPIGDPDDERTSIVGDVGGLEATNGGGVTGNETQESARGA